MTSLIVAILALTSGDPDDCENLVCEDGFPCTVDACKYGACVFCDVGVVHVDWWPSVIQDQNIGDIVELDLVLTRQYLVPDSGVGLARIAIKWDPAVFELLGATSYDELCPGEWFCDTTMNWVLEGFPDDPVNEYWNDGDAYYSVVADIIDGPPNLFVTERMWITRLQFRVLSQPATYSFIEIPEDIPSCCEFDSGDEGHARFCAKPGERCCVNLADAGDCTGLGGHIEELPSAVVFAPTSLGDVIGCDIAGELGTAIYYPSDTCDTFADCGDRDDDGVNDQRCLWHACVEGACVATERVFGDVGGPFGSCEPDGVADGHDRFHILSCFSNTDPNEPGMGYPCEANGPFAINVDAAGQFGYCVPDGVCDGNDAQWILNAFAGEVECRCAMDFGGPVPTDCFPE